MGIAGEAVGNGGVEGFRGRAVVGERVCISDCGGGSIMGS